MNFEQPKIMECHVFRSAKDDGRTKIGVGIIRTLNASYGDMLCFSKHEGTLVVTKNDQAADCLFQIAVDVEGRARLSETNLKQLDAEYEDDLVFTFNNDESAIVEVRRRSSNDITLPEEVEVIQSHPEGATKQITVNAYERDRGARDECLDRFGCNCCVCGFNFEITYGDIGKGYIHVHHLMPIASIGRQYNLNPEQDLRPVCPNCHSMLHRKKPPYTIQELRHILRLSDDDLPCS